MEADDVMAPNVTKPSTTMIMGYCLPRTTCANSVLRSDKNANTFLCILK